MAKVYVYARSSTNEQEDTLTAQVTRGEGEYTLRFAGFGYEWGGAFVDRGVSGSKAFARRPRGFELNLALEKGDVVVLTKLDRGFRSFRDFVDTMARFETKGVRLIVLDLGVDTGTMVGRLVGNILASVAEFERERIGERNRDAAAVRRREGRPVGTPPYGFRIGRKGGADGRRKSLLPDPKARALGATFLRWSEDGWSLDAIYYHLLKERVWRVEPGARHRPGQEWGRSAIARVVAEERRYQAIEAQGVALTARVVLGLPRLPL